jgi:hypothetical protein
LLTKLPVKSAYFSNAFECRLSVSLWPSVERKTPVNPKFSHDALTASSAASAHRWPPLFAGTRFI